ncbi:hypothetical protein F4561_000240 [Lipingzhangella halophila]|uniref:Membrane-bound lytic murein transglycosylase B n=1 Tax=Lipingzhangella halophila TaxID=1783352 RepID=A0A7W7RCN3_9ACTN|nr:transglycosylase SLT domain-containing protein [Lipingzhangella halophila]MBB4929420.1 hypothetical protein [Lipingzhangella halophila]
MSAPRAGPDLPAGGRPPSGRGAAVSALLAVLISVGLAGGIAGAVAALYDPTPPSLPPGAGEDAGSVETVPSEARGAAASGRNEARADLLASVSPVPSPEWVTRVASGTGIPSRALHGYAAAQLRLTEEQPECQIAWPTLAAIGAVESHHGTLTGGEIEPDGRASIDVIGVPLNGADGTEVIADTDGGELDGDPQWDRAVGPMQFIPSTWQRWGSSAADEREPDPQHIDDAALSAARYLCSGGRDLTVARDWWSAIMAYNESQSYTREVLGIANRYVADAG